MLGSEMDTRVSDVWLKANALLDYWIRVCIIKLLSFVATNVARSFRHQSRSGTDNIFNSTCMENTAGEKLFCPSTMLQMIYHAT